MTVIQVVIILLFGLTSILSRMDGEKMYMPALILFETNSVKKNLKLKSSTCCTEFEALSSREKCNGNLPLKYCVRFLDDGKCGALGAG